MYCWLRSQIWKVVLALLDIIKQWYNASNRKGNVRLLKYFLFTKRFSERRDCSSLDGRSKTHIFSFLFFFFFFFVSSFLLSFLPFFLLTFLCSTERSDTVWDLSWSPGFGGFEVRGNKDGGSYITTLSSRMCRAVPCVGMGWEIQGRNKSDGSGLREDYVRSFWKKKKDWNKYSLLLLWGCESLKSSSHFWTHLVLSFFFF